MEIMIWISYNGCVYGKHHHTSISYNNGGFHEKEMLGLVHIVMHPQTLIRFKCKFKG
jgi:hypothetical protein